MEKTKCAYEDMNNLYIECGIAMNDAMNITEEALRINEMTPEERIIEFGRMTKEDALDAAYDHKTQADNWSDYRHDYTKCGLCGSHTEIKSLQLLQQGERKWICAGCDNVVYEKFER